MAKIDKIYIVSNEQGFDNPVNKSVLDKIDVAADTVEANGLSLSGIDLTITATDNPVLQGKPFNQLPALLIVEQTSNYLKTYKNIAGSDLNSQNIASALIEVLGAEEGTQVDSAGGGFINYFNGDFPFWEYFNLPKFGWAIIGGLATYKALDSSTKIGQIGFGSIGAVAAAKYFQSK